MRETLIPALEKVSGKKYDEDRLRESLTLAAQAEDGIPALEQRVDSGDWAVAFALFPTGMQALMDVADAGEVMPPKSTWFEPKLADGLVSHVLD